MSTFRCTRQRMLGSRGFTLIELVGQERPGFSAAEAGALFVSVPQDLAERI